MPLINNANTVAFQTAEVKGKKEGKVVPVLN
jgi:hypothetical protein